ncbi:MAG: tryptophan 7-halogenase [Cyanobacteria bacterium P01_G01_bin.54]
MFSEKNKSFDVVIIGSGLAGSLLAIVLARHNVRVALIDKNAHPRFAIGEAMTPDTDLMMTILSHQYSVPEINHISSFENICKYISPSSCGLKRSFNFMYHRSGEKQNLEETNKLGVEPSSHLFRQEIDFYMAKIAAKYGVELLENTTISDLDINSEGVRVEIQGGETLKASYIVDASGYNSVLSQKFNSRENPTRFKTQSRSLFTHMTGVKHYDDCISETNQDGIFWYQGTLHHIFDGGWMWVIPFNNHEKSENPMCSVGINFDIRKFPKTEVSADREFKDFLAQFPDIAAQFKDASPARKWISTGRLQYSSHSCTGERYYLLPHATGFIDALYSFGLVNSCTIIIPLAARLMEALSTGNYAVEPFRELEQLQQKLLDYNDELVNCSYISFENYNLWDAWRRIWHLGSFMRQTKAGISKKLKIAAGRADELANFKADDSLDSLTPSYEGLGDGFFQNATQIVERVEAGSLSADEAAEQLIALINTIDFLPNGFCQLGNVAHKHIDVTSDLMRSEYSRFMSWVKTSQKPEVKRYFDYDDEDLFAAIERTMAMA